MARKKTAAQRKAAEAKATPTSTPASVAEIVITPPPTSTMATPEMKLSSTAKPSLERQAISIAKPGLQRHPTISGKPYLERKGTHERKPSWDRPRPTKELRNQLGSALSRVSSSADDLKAQVPLARRREAGALQLLVGVGGIYASL